MQGFACNNLFWDVRQLGFFSYHNGEFFSWLADSLAFYFRLVWLVFA